MRAQRLAIQASACCEVRLDAEDSHWRLQQHVAYAGCQRGGTGFGIVGRERIFAFEADDEQADAERSAEYLTTGGCQVCANEAGDVGPSGRGDEQQQRDDGKGSEMRHANPPDAIISPPRKEYKR